MDIPEFQMVPLAALRAPKTNPRRYFDQARFDELKKSVQDHGVLVPLLVRPFDGQRETFEVVAGSRRLKAAQEAKLTEVPVRIRPLTDVQVLEIQVIENLQREDVHPLDEAEGYRTLMERAKYDVQAIADKVGKSASYVYQRLKLTELVEPAKQAFLKDEITAGHAILIARLQAADQKEALAASADDDWIDGRRVKTTISVRGLGSWIEQHIHLDLQAAPFRKDDAALVPAAGPCTTCPKRTGFVPQLFPDIKKKDTCTDRRCFHQKLDAFVVRRKEEVHKEAGAALVELSGEFAYGKKHAKGPLPHDRWKEVKKGSCASAAPGIIVAGHEKGKALTVCADAGCKVHRPSYRYDASPAEKARTKREAEKHRSETTVRGRVLDAVLAKVPAPLKTKDLQLVARASFTRLWHEDQQKLIARHSWDRKKPNIEKFSAQDLARFLIEVSLVRDLNAAPYVRTGDELFATAKRVGVNVAKIRLAARADRRSPKQPKGKKAKKGKVQTSAKK